MRRYSAIGDYNKARSLVFFNFDEGHEHYALFEKRWDWLVAEASKMIEANWHVIDAVASRLFAVGEISGAEVKRIFRRFEGIRKRLSKDPRRYERFHAVSATRKSYL